MDQMTVSQFATELKMPATALLEQLAKAGVAKEATGDAVSEQDKSKLLDYLRKSHGETAPKAKPEPSKLKCVRNALSSNVIRWN